MTRRRRRVVVSTGGGRGGPGRCHRRGDRFVVGSCSISPSGALGLQLGMCRRMMMEDFGPLLEAEIMERMDTATSFMQQLNMGMTPLAIAVTYLLKKGVVPLQYAIQQGNDGLVRLLLSKGASTDISSCEGTPLPVAVSQGKFEIVNTLVQHKADPNRV